MYGDISYMSNHELMTQIRMIEDEMEAVKIRFRTIDNPKQQDYIDRDATIETLLAERDALHEQYKSNVAEGKL